MSFWRSHVVGNPMRAESKRMIRRFFTLGLGRTADARKGMLILVLVYVLCLVGLWVLPVSVPPQGVVIVETALLLVIPIIGFYASISGEREKRSWDFLRVAPVTHSQIVVGKFVSGVTVIGILWLAFLPALLISTFAPPEILPYGGYSTWQHLPPEDVLLAALMPLGSGLMVTAFTLFLSARCKAPLTSLCVSLGSVFAWVAIWPAILSSVSSPGMSEPLSHLTLNPFIFEVAVLDRSGRSADMILDCWIALTVYIGLCATFLAWVTRTLAYADENVKFMPERRPELRAAREGHDPV